MRNLEMPKQCSLFEAKYPRIVNFDECSVAKDLNQRRMISDDANVVAALYVAVQFN